MTRTTNARIAGFTYLFYIAVAFPSMVLFSRATSAEGIPAKLAGIAQHVSDVRITLVLSIVSCFCALVLAVTLYRLTCDEDADVAMLALTCRVAEGIVGATSILATLGLLWLATAAGENAPDAASATTLGAFLLNVDGWTTTIAATFFSVGSLLFSYLLLRGRIVPVALAWLGVLASILVAVALPLQLAGILSSGIMAIWYPMLAFEVTLALWLLIKGAEIPARAPAAARPYPRELS